MARGWESKAVEQQVEDAAPPLKETAPIDPDVSDAERKHKLDTLKLVRSQVNQQLQNARTVAQRQTLHQRLKAIDADLEALQPDH